MVIHKNGELFKQLISNTNIVNGCWEWAGGLYWDGYGQKGLRINNKKVTRRAHRLVFECLYGPLGDKHVCHRCDNPKCINPAHLFLGTKSENMSDMLLKKRGKKIHQCARGEKIAKAKLKSIQIPQILELKKLGFSIVDIAANFGVRASCISAVINGVTWNHITKLPKRKY